MSKFAILLFFSFCLIVEAGSRPDVAKVIILITDGKSTDDPLEIAKLIHDWKVLVYTVGVGQADQQELLQIASEKDNHYDVKNYNSIADIKKSLLGKVCNDVETEAECDDARDVDLMILQKKSPKLSKNLQFSNLYF